MKNTMKLKAFSTTAAIAVTALMIGCSHNTAPKQIDGKEFAAEDQPTSIGRFAEAQGAAGAKEDAMLYDHNFHGGELNSLGQGKLSLIVKGTPVGDPVYVYLNMPHDQVTARQTAVTAYLKTAGVADDKIIVAEGPNPNLSSPTAYNLSGIYKAEGTSYSGEAAPETSTAAAPMGGGGSH